MMWKFAGLDQQMRMVFFSCKLWSVEVALTSVFVVREGLLSYDAEV